MILEVLWESILSELLTKFLFRVKPNFNVEKFDEV